jgi:RNA polymerase sigma factor (sigma-70 family)
LRYFGRNLTLPPVTVVRPSGRPERSASSSAESSHYSDRRRPWRRESTSTTRVDLALEPGMTPGDADAIWTAIRSLPAGQRKVVVLRHIWDCSVEETAAELGVSISTVKSQARDALAALRRALTSDFGTNSLQGEER